MRFHTPTDVTAFQVRAELNDYENMLLDDELVSEIAVLVDLDEEEIPLDAKIKKNAIFHLNDMEWHNSK